MLDLIKAKDELLNEVAKLQYKKELSSTVTDDYYEPGMMEYLDQYLGVFDEKENIVRLRTEAKGLRYDERSSHIEFLRIGDPVKLVREPSNPFNGNNIMIFSKDGEDIGNLPANLCNVISPLLDIGYLTISESHITYLERVKDRSRYAQQGVLFVEIVLRLFVN